MKILQVLPELQAGGVERGTVEIAHYLTANGHDSHVASTGGRLVQFLNHGGTTHHRLNVAAKNARSLVGVLEMRRLLVQIRPDIVHVRSRIPGWVVDLAYKTLPKHLRPTRITTFHGFYSVNKYSEIMTKGEKIIAVSRNIAEHINQEYGVPKSKIEVIYRGIDPEYFNPVRVDSEARLNLRRQWQVPDELTPVLLMPGRFTRLKGHMLLLKALASLADMQWKVVFVGDYKENQRYTNELFAFADQLGLRSKLHFHGQSNDMPLVYAASDLVLNVSGRPESFGRTAVEGMAMKKPVIASAHGGGMETVLPDETGWYFTPNDAYSLADSLKEAFRVQNTWDSIGENGRRHVVAYFTLEGMCQATLAVYNTLCHNEA